MLFRYLQVNYLETSDYFGYLKHFGHILAKIRFEYLSFFWIESFKILDNNFRPLGLLCA